jgi:putative ABC transport system permease protein
VVKLKKTYFKNILRDITKTFSRFASILVIIAIGVSFYAGVRATSPDMQLSGDYYMTRNNLMDFKLISTFGLTQNDLSAVKEVPGVASAEGAYSMDAVIERGGRSLVVNINSLPPENGINTIKIVAGRAPQSNGEAVVEDRFFKENNLKIGDTIQLASGKSTDIGNDLKTKRFKVVGTAQSPLYISALRQLSSVGNGAVKGFVYILPDVFKNNIYTEIYAKVKSNESKSSLLNNDAYQTALKPVEQRLKDIGTDRNAIRYAEVVKEANRKISDSQKKLDESKVTANQKFAAAYVLLDSAAKKLTLGESQLKINRDLFNRKMTEGEQQIEMAKAQLSDGQKQLDSAKAAAMANIVTVVQSKLDEAKALMDSNPSDPTLVAQYYSLNQMYINDIYGKTFDEMYSSLTAHDTFDQMMQMIDVKSMKDNFDHEQATLDASAESIAASEIQLKVARQAGLAKLEAAAAKIDEGKKEITLNTAKLRAEETKAYAAIRTGEAKLLDYKDKIKNLKTPDWYVLGRSTNIGYESYRLDSERIGDIGKVFPLLFFLVAALVSLTTMTRMVLEKRTEIGTLKSIGYSDTAIITHYLIYSLVASLTGSIIGISFAFKLFPPLIMNAYKGLYTIPYTIAPFNFSLAVGASLLAILFTTLATVAATMGELRESPASLMRPKPPKTGKKIFLERFTFIWKRMSFTKKVTARNLFRYKQRLLMTVIGIAVCTGLIVTGFGIREGITGAAELQFTEIYKYDMQATLNTDINNAEMQTVKAEVNKNDNIKSVLFSYTTNGTVNGGSTGKQDFYLVVPENKNSLGTYIKLTKNNERFNLTDTGVIITEQMAQLINKKAGDIIGITVDGKTANVKIAAVTKHFIQHYIYMSPVYYQKTMGTELKFNRFYGMLTDTSSSAEDNTTKVLTGIRHVESISYKNRVHFDYSTSMSSINSVIIILIISAGVLAFVVIYNLINININERKRELATIKLLGFYNKELAAYIYKENTILTVIGALSGVVVGVLMNKIVLSAVETSGMMFLKTISPIYLLYSVLITMGFSLVVNLFMYREFDKIDMIESLKSVE